MPPLRETALALSRPQLCSPADEEEINGVIVGFWSNLEYTAQAS